MKTRIATLVSRKSFAASGIIDKDLKGTDPISFLDIIVRMTNGSAMTEASIVKIQDDITKIEVVDGGDVLVSANMEEFQALNAFENKAWPYENKTLEDNAVQTATIRIPFGLSPFDPIHYLRPNDFENLQVKVTVTMTTAAATSWAASGHDVTILAGVMESGYGSYAGFLSTKSIKSYAAVDGTREDIDLNTDWPYRCLLIQAFKTATRPDQNIELVKLTADNDSYVSMDLYATELEAMNAIQFGRFSQNLQKRMKAAGDTVLADFYLDTVAAAHGGTTLIATEVLSVTAESVVVESYDQT